MPPPPLTAAQLQHFESQGYVMVDALAHPQVANAGTVVRLDPLSL